MRKFTRFSIAAHLLAVVAMSGISHAQDAAPADELPSLNDLMAEAMVHSAPIEAHDRLRRLAGEWNYVVEMTMPGVPPKRGSGTTSVREILGGRFIEMRSTSEGSPPVQSVMFLGYDKRGSKSQYFSIGLDSLGTWYTNPHGQWNNDTASLELRGAEHDPATGAAIPYRQVFRFPAEDTMTLDVYASVPGQQDELRIFGIVYQRHERLNVVAPPANPLERGRIRPLLDRANTSTSGEAPNYSAESIEKMDRTDLQAAMLHIARARTVQGIEQAAHDRLNTQFDQAMKRMQQLQEERRATAGDSTTTAPTAADPSSLPSFADTEINAMTTAEVRAAISQISQAPASHRPQ